MRPSPKDHAPKIAIRGYPAVGASELCCGPGLGYAEFLPSKKLNWSWGCVRMFCIHARSSHRRRWRLGAGEKRSQVCQKGRDDLDSSLISRPQRAGHGGAFLWTYCFAPELQTWLVSARGRPRRICQKEVSFLGCFPSVTHLRRKMPTGRSRTRIAGFQKSQSSASEADYFVGTSGGQVPSPEPGFFG